MPPTSRTCQNCGLVFTQHRGRPARWCRPCRSAPAVLRQRQDSTKAARARASKQRIERLEKMLQAREEGKREG